MKNINDNTIRLVYVWLMTNIYREKKERKDFPPMDGWMDGKGIVSA